MKLKLSCAIIICFNSITALADFKMYIIPNPRYEGNLTLKEIDIAYDKEIEKYANSLASENYKIVPFVVKEMQINIMGIEAEANLKLLYKDYLSKELTQQMLQELNSKLVEYCVNQDYLFPIMEITHYSDKGILVINIKIGSINNVIIDGDGKNDDLINAYANKINESKPTKIKQLQKYIALIKKIPGYKVNYILKPNPKQPLSEIDLTITTKKINGEIVSNMDNTGSHDTGKIKPSIIAQKFSLTDDKDSLIVHGSTTNHPDRSYEIGFGYSRIINTEGTSIHLFSSHSSDNPNKVKDINTDDSRSNKIRLSLNHHLFINNIYDLEGEIGFNHKDSLSYTVDNNIARRDQKANYWSSDLALKYHFIDSYEGKNYINLTYVQGIAGRFKNYGNSLDIANKNFNQIKLNVYKDQPLANNFSFFAHLNASYSNSSLPDDELFKLGGRDFGRGYSFDTINGNRMLAASFEARYNYKLKENFIINLVQPYLFYDTAYAGKQPSNTNISHLTSWGGGLRFKFHHDVELGTEIAIPTKKSYIVKGDAKTAKTNFGIFISKKIVF